MPGGRIAPDGRPAQAPGVGKTAKRHDLEAPATPGLSGTDLQYGDVQALEQGQRIAPRPKQTQGAAAPKPRPQQSSGGGQPFNMERPDPIEFAAKRMGGQAVIGASGQQEPLDVEKWRPLLREIAVNPLVSGPLTTSLFTQLTNIASVPNTSSVRVYDQNAADVALKESL